MRSKTVTPWLLIVFTSILLSAVFSPTRAQSVGNYAVTRATGVSYVSVLNLATPCNSWRNTGSYIDDDNRSYPVNIGFDFWYDGVRYTTVCVSTNGYLDFSNSTADGGPTGGPYGYQNTRFTTINGTLNALAPFYDDMTTQGAVNPLGNSIRTYLSGTAPNRIFTIEWFNLAVYGNTTPSMNFQVKLHETTGVIDYPYGTMNAGTATFSYTCGINGPVMNSSPTVAQLSDQQTANTATFSNAVQNSLSVMPAANSILTFTPPVPLNPSGSLTFSGVQSSQMTLNFPNWATNEVGYVIYNSTDAINWNFISQTAANATSALVTGLYSSTTYYWRVYAVTEGCLSSTFLSGTQATTAGSTYISVVTGNWNTASTWNINAVPGAGDNVIIANGHTVTINVNAACNNLTINQGGAASVLRFGNNATNRSLDVNGNIIVGTNGTLTVNVASNTTHQLNLYGNLTNNGVVDLQPDLNSFCDVAFLHPYAAQVVNGSGATNKFNNITVNKGPDTSRIVDMQISSFVAATGFLTLVNGTFKISTTAASTVTPYTATSDIPSSTRLWLNSSSLIANTTGGNINLFGQLQVTSGTLNIGNATDNSLVANGGLFLMNGGTVNIAGRFDRANVVTLTRFNITAGTLTVNTTGSTSTTNAPFMMDVSGSQFSQSGGLIIIRRSGGANLGFLCTGANINAVTGGVLQIGDVSSPAGQTIRVNTVTPVGGFRVASANVTALLITNPLTVINDVELQSGTFNTSNLNVTAGGNWTNTGGTYTFGTNTTTFNGAANAAINGSAITQTFNNVVVQKNAGSTLSVGGSTTTVTLNNFTETSGNFTSAATLNVNTAAASAVVLTAGTFTFGTTVNITGNWTNNGASTVPATSTTNFTGTAAQAISGTATSQNFYNIVLLKTAGTTLSVGGSTTTLTTNNITETTGNFTAPATLNVTASSSASVLLTSGIFTAGTTMNITGNWTKNGGTFIPGTGTTNFTGTLAQAINGTAVAQNFYNVVVAKTAGTTLSVGGSTTTLTTNNLTETSGNFTAPATLNINASAFASLLLTAGNFTAGSTTNITGDWTYNGGNFFPGTGVVNFTGTLNQTIGGAATSQTFYNVVIAKSAGTTLASGGSTNTITTNNLTETTGNFNSPATLNINSTATANLLLSSGTFTAGTTTNIKGNWTNNGGTFIPGTGRVNFTGTLAQAINGTATSQSFYDIFILKTAGTTLTVGGSTSTINTNKFTETTGNFTAPSVMNVNATPTAFILLTSGTFTAGNIINLNGDWTDNGATVVPGSSTINFSTSGSESVSGTIAVENFNHINFINGGLTTIGFPINCGNITINAGDSVSVGATGFTISARGNFINNGNFAAGTTGTVICNGGATQTIGGTSVTTFRNLTINGAGATLATNEKIHGTLTLTSGMFTTTGFTFTLLSDISGTARIAEITGGDITGNITMQRYIYTGPTEWRQMCAPVSGTTLADWNDDLVTSGFPGSDFPAMAFYSIATYDETAPGLKSVGYSAPTSVTNPIVADKGYFVYVGPLPVPVAVTGAPLKFGQSYSLTYTPSAGLAEDGWNMVANPYPSSIDWDAAGWTRTNTDNVLSIWNPSLRQYASYVSGIGVNGGSKNIPSSHAFWVHAIAAGPSISLTESVKTFVDQSYMRSAQIQSQNNLLSLSVTGSPGTDQSIIRFDPAATDTFDVNMDAYKLASSDTTVPYLASVTTNFQDLSINTLPTFNSDITVPLRVKAGVTGNYTIRRDSISDLPNSMCITLEDLLTGTTTQLTQNATYSFFMSDTTSAVRFILHFGPALTAGDVPATCLNHNDGKAFAKGTGNGPWDYTWKDASGNIIATHSNISGTDTLSGLIPANYIVEVNGNNGYCNFRTDTISVTGPPALQTGATFTPSTCSYTNDGAIIINAITGGTPPFTLTWSDGSNGDTLANVTMGNYQLFIADTNGCIDTVHFILPTNSSLTADFVPTPDTAILNSLILFQNSSSNTTSSLWDFGDGGPQSTTTSPNYSYGTAGTFTVMLVADDGTCQDTTYHTVLIIDNTGINPFSNDGNVEFTTGPESFGVLFDLPVVEKGVIKVYTSTGELYASKEDYVGQGRVDIPMDGAATGTYLIFVQLPDKMYSTKVVLIR